MMFSRGHRARAGSRKESDREHHEHSAAAGVATIASMTAADRTALLRKRAESVRLSPKHRPPFSIICPITDACRPPALSPPAAAKRSLRLSPSRRFLSRPAGTRWSGSARWGRWLTSLEEGGYLSVDYDLPLSGYGYEEFKESELYAYFCRTVEEASRRKGFLGDLPVLELGSIAPL